MSQYHEQRRRSWGCFRESSRRAGEQLLPPRQNLMGTALADEAGVSTQQVMFQQRTPGEAAAFRRTDPRKGALPSRDGVTLAGACARGALKQRLSRASVGHWPALQQDPGHWHCQGSGERKRRGGTTSCTSLGSRKVGGDMVGTREGNGERTIVDVQHCIQTQLCTAQVKRTSFLLPDWRERRATL